MFSAYTATLYVPEGKAANYGKDCWNKFANIEEGYLVDATIVDGNTYDFVQTAEGRIALLTKGTAAGSAVTIPTDVELETVKYAVKRIGKAAFAGNTKIETLTISGGIETVDAYAFQKCTALKTVMLPSSLRSIGDYAFDQCTNIRTVNSGISADNLFDIADNVFATEIRSTVTVYVPEGAKSAYKAKAGWKMLVNYIEGEKQQETIGDMTYEYLTGPKTATLVSTTTTDVKVTIPGTVTINNVAYTVTAIGSAAFKNVTAMESLLISENIETIGTSAFQGCTNLKKIWLPESLASIGKQAFDGCSKITHVSSDALSLPASASEMVPVNSSALLFVPKGKTAVYEGKTGWQYFAKIYEGHFVDEITPSTSTYKDMTFICLADADGKTAILTKSKTSTDDVIIPASVSIDDDIYLVTEIDKSAFSASTNLKNITIPENVTKIGDYAFASCTQLTNIICKVENPIAISSTVFPNVPAALYVPNKQKYAADANWNMFSPIYTGERRVAANDVLNLTYEYATGEQTARLIKGASTAADVTIDNIVPGTDKKVTVIAAQAFSSSKNLTNLVIPENVETIGAAAFKGCTAMKTLTLPSTLKAIGEEAFADSKALTTIYSNIVAADLFEINTNVFSSEISPTIYIPIGNENLKAYQTTPGWDRFKNNYVVGDKDSGIDENYPMMTFEYLTGYGTATLIKVAAPVPEDKTITIPAEVTINKGTYKVTAVGDNVFKDNTEKTKVEKLEIGENVTKIGDNAFQGLTGLQTVKFAEKARLTAIGAYAFSGNTKLEELHLPASLENIGTSAFQGCTSLRKIWLPANLAAIGKQAFDGCSKITHVCSSILSPSSISDDVFSIADKNTATLFVPSKAGYNTGVWTKFSNVVIGEYVADTEDEGMTYACYKTTVKNDAGESVTLPVAILTKSETSIQEALIKSVTLGEPVSAGSHDMIYYDVVAIGKYAFKGCTSLKKIELPSTLTAIGDYAFADCSGITEIVSNIETAFPIYNVFNERTYTIAHVYIPGDLSSYENTDGWKDFNHNNYEVGKWLETPLMGYFKYKYHTVKEEATIVEIILPETEETLTIPSSVVIGEGSNKMTYQVSAIDPTTFINKDKVKKLILSEKSREKDGVETIAANAFKDCSNLQTVLLPSTLKELGSKAFNGCKSLKRVSCKGKTLPEISEDVFPANIEYLFIPEGTSVNSGWTSFAKVIEGHYVDDFKSSDGIAYICMENGEDNAVEPTALLTKAPTTITDIASSIVYNGVTHHVTIIGESAFENNTSLKNLVIPEGVRIIGRNAFKKCSNMQTIDLPSTLKEIGDYAFDQCSKISMVTSKIEKEDLFGFKTNVFQEVVYASATVYVPYDENGLTVAKYQDTEGWQEFAYYEMGEKKQTKIGYMTYEYMTATKTATLTGTTISKDVVTIDGTITIDGVDYKVTTIAESVFKNNVNKKSIEKLIIAENIQTIGAYAFQGCTSLEQVWLPSTLKSIGEKAFDGCTAITHVSSKIDNPTPLNAVFSSKSATLYVPKGRKNNYNIAGWNIFAYVGEGEFVEVYTDYSMTFDCLKSADGKKGALLKKYSASTTDVVIPALVETGGVAYTVTVIGKPAFNGNTKITSVILPEGLETIDEYAFQKCTALKTVDLPSTLKEIGGYAFDNCGRLELVVSHIENPFAISENVFPVTNAKLNVPIGTTDLYEAAGWSKFFAMTLEGEILEKEIDGMTYIYATGSRTATLTKATTKEKELTISDIVTIDGKDYSMTAIGESAFANQSTLEKLYINEGIVSIGANAFKNCAYLTLLSLPSTLTNIGDNAFSKCDRLAHIQSAVNHPFDISDNVFTTTAYNNATLYIPVNSIELYSEANGWKNFGSILEGNISEVTIEGMAYICVSNLKIAKLIKGINTKEVTIPSKIYKNNIVYQVVGIEKSAFYGYGTLEKLVVSENVKTIGMTAFKNCYKLKSVSLPASLEFIGESAFENCSRLEKVICAGEVPADISSNTFPSVAFTVNVPSSNAASLFRAHEYWGQYTILVNMSSITDDDDEKLPGIYQIITEEGEEEIPAVAIIDDASISGSFELPETIDYMGTTYTVTVIAPGTFENNVLLTAITIPSTITAIGESAFTGCSNLKSITVNIATPLDLSGTTEAGNSTVFEGIDLESCILYVPDESVELYKSADVWKEFKNIRPISSAGISRVLAGDGMPFDVYNLQGIKVRANTKTLKGLASGVYVVNGKKINVK